MSGDKTLLWLDLETTGLGDDAQIIEVACCMTEPTAPFERIDKAHFHALVTPVAPWSASDVVVSMHARNGLWVDLATQPHRDVREVEDALLDWLDVHEPNRTAEVTLAGSGVARFDFVKLQQFMPRVAAKLTYYTFDTGVIRRWLVASGQPVDDEPSNHRAWDDVESEMVAARAYSARFSSPGHFVCAVCLTKIDGPMIASQGTRVVHYPHCPDGDEGRWASSGPTVTTLRGVDVTFTGTYDPDDKDVRSLLT